MSLTLTVILDACSSLDTCTNLPFDVVCIVSGVFVVPLLHGYRCKQVFSKHKIGGQGGGRLVVLLTIERMSMHANK